MSVWKVLVRYGGTNERHIVDAIFYNGGLWLVPEWLEQPSEKLMKPARIILVEHMAKAPANPETGAALVLMQPLPKALFDCSVPLSEGTGFEVQDLPPILLNDDGTPSDRGITVILTKSPSSLQ